MAALTHVQSMIDYGLIRYGEYLENLADARAHLLSFYQAAEEECWVIAPWSWREWEYTTFNFSVGTAVYTLPTDVADVLHLYNSESDEIKKVTPSTWNRYYPKAPASGVPTRWTFFPNHETSQALTIAVWPTPGAGQTDCRMIAEKRVAELEDSDTSFSNFPEGSRMLVVLRGLKTLAIHEGKTGLQQEVQADLDRFLASLAAKDREHWGGRL